MRRDLLLMAALLAACVPDPSKLPIEPKLEVPSSAFLSVAGTAEGDVWIAGARPSPTDSPVLLHYNGDTVESVETGQLHDLWWVHTLDDGTVYAAGAGATVLQIRDGVVERMDTPRFFGNTIFGAHV